MENGLDALIATCTLRAWRPASRGRAPPWTGSARAFSTSSASSRRSEERTAAHHSASPQLPDQRCAYRYRYDGILVFRESRLPPASERQLLATGENSRTTRPSMYGLAASLSLSFEP